MEYTYKRNYCYYLTNVKKMHLEFRSAVIVPHIWCEV